ncbi:PREDICTED: uncharacterized protein LOC109205359 [Nicotiana attenuata]|uniref:uncharacterized protein LOC109205359 n=1 Tax=Nicotiana attenuata TaxID=49451 RepID=UPI00090473D3|nr:PREDICTED: uncharacterized protein LOC109205359 [Nicotiana attenuata]
MTAFNPLTGILSQNKLEGPNYADWKRNLDIVLIAEEYKFVLDEVCPEKPGDDATDDEQKSIESAYDILENLNEMFGDQNPATKQTAMKALLNTKMVEGSSVRDHVLKMSAETIIKSQTPPVELNFEACASSKQRGGQKKKKAQKPSVGGTTTGVKKAKGKCYHCK